MKLILPVSIFLAILVIILPFMFARSPDTAITEQGGDAPEQVQAPAESPPSFSMSAADAPLDGSKTLRLKSGDEVITLTLYEYLCGVVAAEMSASFYDEALKAQAVVARTYTYYTAAHRPKEGGAHPDADVCDIPAHCQGWFGEAELRERWGENYEANVAKIAAAVAATDGVLAMYDGQPICAVFHSSSGGYTEDSVNVWSEALPYLTSVESPESSTSVPDFITHVSYTLADFKRTALETYPDMTFPDAPENWITNVTRSDTERIVSLKVGGITLTGTQFRLLFGLRSANAAWSVADGVITITVTGYGHGVGMSQFGANEFARNGASFDDIIRYYYKGVDVRVPGGSGA